MTNAESRILSLLRPGDMVRFCIHPDADGRIEVYVEGAAAEIGDGFLQERLDLALGELRNHGYLFGEQSRPAKPKARSSRTKPKQGATRWVEICPRSLDIVPLRSDSMGFCATASHAGAVCVRIPDLPRSLDSELSNCLSELVRDVPRIVHFEVDFTRTELPAECLRTLEESLRMQANANLVVAEAYRRPSVTEAFLGFWLAQRTGWKVTARAFVSGSGKLPIAALEMIGRDLFRCECETHVEQIAADSTSALDLSDCFPCGWPFPPVLPGLGSLESFAARRFHNVSLPDLPKLGMFIGTAEGLKVRLPRETRDRHTYIVGATGTGKSTLLAHMIKEDMERGEGVILLDPHGDLFFEILDSVPAKRRGDLTVIDPVSDKTPPGINFLDVSQSPRPAWRLRFMINELLQFFDGVWDLRNVGGPMFEMYFRNAILLLGDQGVREKSCHSLLNFASVMSDPKFRNHQLEVCRDTEVKDFWKGVAEKAGGEAALSNITPYIVSKMDLLTQSSFIRKLIGSPKDTLCIREKMDRHGIVLCNLSKGTLGAHESRLLGSLLMAQIFAAGMERGIAAKSNRRPVNIYVDEFQNFVSDNVASMLSEARKFGLRLTLANQTLSQLKANAGKQDLLETVLGNIGNMILFRLGVPDADRMKLFIEPFSRQEMQELPNFHALIRLLTTTGPVRPLIMQTLKP